MAIIRELNGIAPKMGKNCFIAENAAIIGDVSEHSGWRRTPYIVPEVCM